MSPSVADVEVRGQVLVSRAKTKTVVFSKLNPALSQCPGYIQAVMGVGVAALIRWGLQQIQGPPPGQVRIWVKDNGLGIPKDAQERIFAMFHRMHHEADYPGIGIWLTIVKKAGEKMKGRVGLKSEPGHESRFWIELPKAVAAPIRTHLREAG